MQASFLKGHPGKLLIVAVALLIPALVGCSTLGIATTDDLTAAEQRMTTSSGASQQRIAELEKTNTEMNQTLQQVYAEIDSLNNSFAEAKQWLQSMDLATISEDAKNASASAQAANSFLVMYLEWLKEQHAVIEKQMAALQQLTAAAPAAPDASEEDEGSSDS